ncbi:MAG TPA: hypothetical protein VD902_06105 [Symbiobacteriaceae bacterium]|nr:hypothetical protein [Symbiobacteriaceae bacterium]
MFMFRRHHHGHCSLFKLLLVLLGFRFLIRRTGGAGCGHSKEEQEAFKAKAKSFRAKLKDAFAVWSDEPEEKGEAKAEEKPEEKA